VTKSKEVLSGWVGVVVLSHARVELHDLPHLAELLDGDAEGFLNDVPRDFLGARRCRQRSRVATDVRVVDNVVYGVRLDLEIIFALLLTPPAVLGLFEIIELRED